MTEEPKTVQVKWTKGGENELILDEHVYPDRSCGQYEAGWIAFHQFNDKVSYFVATTGEVYLHGTSEQIGIVPTLDEAAKRYEAEMEDWQEREQAELDRHYQTGGM